MYLGPQQSAAERLYTWSPLNDEKLTGGCGLLGKPTSEEQALSLIDGSHLTHDHVQEIIYTHVNIRRLMSHDIET